MLETQTEKVSYLDARPAHADKKRSCTRKQKRTKNTCQNVPPKPHVSPIPSDQNDKHSNESNGIDLNLNSKGLNIGYLNIQGICANNKFDEVKIMLTSPENSNLHIFGLSETKLKDRKKTSAFQINGFQTPFRKDNHTNGGGGLIMYVRNGINAKRRSDLEKFEIACIWLEITPEKGKSFLVGCMYRPPDSKVEWVDRFENFMDHALNEGKEIIVLGDINKNLLDEQINREWLNFINSLGLSQLVAEPTRVTNTTSTLIDHIYSNYEENISQANVSKLCMSDHFAIFCNRKINHSASKNTHQTITYRSFKHFDETSFITDLHLVPWEVIHNYDTIDDVLSAWMELFLEIVNKHAPLRIHRVKNKIQPDWLSSEILDCIKERNKCKLNGQMEQYTFLRNKVSTMIQNSKKDSYKSKIEEGKDDPRSIWKIFKEFGASKNDGNSENILGIKNENNTVCTDKVEVANIFNDYFVNVASKLKEPVSYSDSEELKTFINSSIPSNASFTIPEINEEFVYKFLSHLDVSKATGLDFIGPRLLKIASASITPSITYIINTSITSGTFPKTWKQAKVNPIYKSGAKDEANNYRPISILPTLSKLIEKWVQKHIMDYLNNFNLLHQTQSGFRAGHSTESALILMIDNFLRAINQGKLVGCILVDFRKAFDLVDHTILLQKLKLYKCTEQTVKWFQSYLEQRSQVVSINGEKSEDMTVQYGVPQGSILGPVLFLLFINDLPLSLAGNVTGTDLYADDTSIYDIQSSKTDLQNNLQEALTKLGKWCKSNGMLLNTDKTKVMLITTRQKRTSMPEKDLELKYDDIDLHQISGDRILGIHIDQNLQWNTHFNNVCKKISSYLWLLSKIRSFLSIEHRTLFYKAYIQPHFGYCNVVWGESSNVNISKFTKLQRRACKLILAEQYIDLNTSLQILNILNFDECVFFQKAKTMYKITNHLTPQYLCDLFEMRPDNSEQTNMTLRSSTNRNYIVPKPRNTIFKSSFSYSGAIIWNSIPLEIRKSNSLNTFSNNCLKWMRNG
ncbi:MAG: reverse transcriptase family protein [Sedimenticola sp.]